MQGNNFVELVGFLKYPELKETYNGNLRFQGKIAVPYTFTDRETGEAKESSKYIKISAWGDTAQNLGGLPDGTALCVQGMYNERSYDGNCKSCGNPEKKYWTDVLVDNFAVVEE